MSGCNAILLFSTNWRSLVRRKRNRAADSDSSKDHSNPTFSSAGNAMQLGYTPPPPRDHIEPQPSLINLKLDRKLPKFNSSQSTSSCINEAGRMNQSNCHLRAHMQFRNLAESNATKPDVSSSFTNTATPNKKKVESSKFSLRVFLCWIAQILAWLSFWLTHRIKPRRRRHYGFTSPANLGAFLEFVDIEEANTSL